MTTYKEAISLALENIIHFGDTDIFPSSIENILFEDKKDHCIQHFEDLNSKNRQEFDKYLSAYPPVNFSTVCSVGNTGYRWATLIDPYWNAYFLSLVLKIAQNIEDKRIKNEYVYSYRFFPNLSNGSLFDKEINWKKFQKDSITLCENESNNIAFVVSCDIADFYPRIYHHRLENELQRLAGTNSELREVTNRITSLMQKFSDTKSYGLPIGGPASRMLAELALTAIDKLLLQRRVKFKRFVDDYLIFCSSKEEAHSLLMFLNTKLIENEGLTLQKNKSLILSKEEFINIASAKIYGVSEDIQSTEKARFLNLPVRFDPYSPNAEQEYEEIKASLQTFDLFSMLVEEIKKSNLNQIYTRHILKSLKFQDDDVISNSLRLMFENISELYTIYNVIIQTTISLWNRISDDVKEGIFLKLEELHENNSYLLQIDVNLAYTVKLFSLFCTDESLIILNDIMESSKGSLIKKLVIQAMGKQNNISWLSDLKNTYSTQSELEKRIFIVCSYLLGDEGRHWKTHNTHGFTPIQNLYKEWASQRKNKPSGIESAL
ncbi:RNA-directed DNA polymerase [Acinetobacter guillouiae]|uniref:RNA-directed DNA polymerase n=1 Tax=Acinetobacter guillouiae TaxID=106649 RepID=UPI003AF9CF49